MPFASQSAESAEPNESAKIYDSAAWREMWENPEADATVLNAMVLSKYGEDALDWDPITIQMEARASAQTELSANTVTLSTWCSTG